MKSSLKSLADNYQDKNGNNPFVSAISILTFLKSIPIHMFFAALSSLMFFITMTWITLAMFSEVNLLMKFIVYVFGIIPALIIAVVAFAKYVTSSFLSSLKELLIGILQPIDDIYDKWKEVSTEKISKKEFISKFFREVIFPNLKNQLIGIFFKKKLTKALALLSTNFFSNDSVEDEDNTKNGDDNTLKSSIKYIRSSINAIDRVFSKPFYWSLYSSLTCYVILWIIYYFI